MTKIRCKLGGYSPIVMGHTYHFTRDPDIPGAFTAEVTDDKHVEVLLAVEHYERVGLIEEAVTVPPPPPPPTGLTREQLLELVEQAGYIHIEVRTVKGMDIYVVTGPWPELVGVSNEMMAADATWYTITGDELHVDVMNGRAKYLLLGKIEAGGIFKLSGTPTFEAPPEADKVLLLGGSADLPGTFHIDGVNIDVTDIVAAVVAAGNYSPEAWNDLDEAKRDELIKAHVASTTKPHEPPPAPSSTPTADPPPATPPAAASSAPAEKPARKPRTPKPQLDHDGDGKAGGSKPRRRAKAVAEAQQGE